MHIRFHLLLLVPLAVSAADSPFRDLFFEPNRGQMATEVQYIARAPGAKIAVTSDGLTFQLAGETLSMRLKGASSNARFEPLDASPDSTSYFVGADSSRWVRDVPHYRRLEWRGVYPGVDLVFYGREGRLEYDFVVAPGADPTAIQLAFDRSSKISLTADGDLAIGSRSGFRMKKPVLYQHLADGSQQPVDGWYKFGARGHVRFKIGRYEHGRALVIDPILTFASYYGGEKDDSVVAVTNQGDIVGVTSSLAFGNGPPRMGKDIFAILQNTQGFGARLMIFGGSDDDVATSAVGDSNFLIIGGWTRSSDFLSKGGFGGADGFLLAIDRRGQYSIPQITRVGGSGDDKINALWGTGITYFAGETTSPDLTLNGQPLQTQLAGGSDAFFGRAYTYAGGGSLGYLAYFGGSGDDAAYAIVSDQYRIVIAGKTTSTDLPTKDALSAQLSGPSDAFVARFTVNTITSTTLEFGTYLGGSGNDEIRGLATPAAGSIYFAGTTSSTDLPLVNPAQPQYGGGESDAFAGQLNLDTRTLVFNTYIGGSGRDEAAAISHASSNYYGGLSEPVVAGSTTSPDLPVVNALQGQLAGIQDAFLAYFDGLGALQSLSYFGGSGADRGLALSVSGNNVATIGGETDSADLPMPALNYAPSVLSGGLDGFVSAIALTRFTIVEQSQVHWTGADMTVFETLFVSADVPGTALLTISSSDPSRVLVALDPTLASASVTVPLATLSRAQGYINFYLVGLASSGESIVTITLDGFPPIQRHVRLGSPVTVLSSSSTQQPIYVGQASYITASLVVPTDVGGFVYGSRRVGASPVTISLSLSNPAIASLNQATIVLGGSSSNSAVYLTASDSGDTTLSGSSDGPPMRDLAGIPFSFIYPTFTLADFAVGNNLERSVFFQSSNAAPAFDVLFTVTSDDPQSLCLVNSATNTCSGSLDVSWRYPFVVRGLAGSGSVQLHYSNPKAGGGAATVNLTSPKIFIDPPSTLTVGYSGSIQVTYGASTDTRDRAALRFGFDPGLMIVSSDSTIVSVSPYTPQQFAIQAIAPGTATVTVSAPGFDASAPFAITVTPPAGPVLNVPTTTIALGKNLQASIYVTAPALPSSAQIHISSSDPTLLLVSTDAASVGAAQADSTSSYTSFYLQALVDSGSASVTLSAAGAPSVTIPIRFVPSGYAWNASAAAVSANSTATIGFSSYSLDPDSLAPVQIQQTRAGVTFKPSVSSSNPSAGTFILAASGISYTAGVPGTATLSLTQPSGFATPAIRGDIRVIVNPATVSATVPLFIGKDLQIRFTTSANNAQFPITISSDDPSRLLISSSSSAVGAAQVATNIGAAVYLQSLAADGTVAIHISGSGVEEAVFPVTLAPAGVSMFQNGTTQGPVRLTTLSADLTLSASLFTNSPVSSYTSESFAIRAGASPLQVPVTSTQPNVATPLSTTLLFSPGQTGPINFGVRPQNPGDTVINLTPPAPFSTGAGVAVKVAQPSFMTGALNVGKDFETQNTLQLDSYLTLPSTIIVTIASNDPSRVLLSTRPDQPGQASIALAYGNSSPAFYVQGIAVGQATIVATTSGFDPATIPVNITQPTLSLSGPQTAFVGQASSAYLNFNQQTVRPGAQISISLHSSDPTIATIDSTVIAVGGKTQVAAAIQPLLPGTTTITADLPDGFVDTPATRTFDLAVKLPSLPFNSFQSTYAIGKDLQAGASLFQTGSGPINLTISSSDPKKVLVSTDGTKAGLGTLSFSIDAFHQTTLYIQALADSGSVTLTFSASGYAPMQAKVNLYPSTFAFEGSAQTTTKPNPFDFSVTVGPMLPSGVAFTNGETLRPGIGPLSVPVISSQPAVGTLKPSTLIFNANDSRATARFTPTATGNTILTITEPSGFVNSLLSSQFVVVVN